MYEYRISKMKGRGSALISGLFTSALTNLVAASSDSFPSQTPICLSLEMIIVLLLLYSP